MRLWKVKTHIDLIIETNKFGKKKRHMCYFTHDSKFIFAQDTDTAKQKYKDIYFSSIKDSIDKHSLFAWQFLAETYSDNMKFDLSFNQKILHVNEYVICDKDEIKDTFFKVMHNSTAQDFRDWWHDDKPLISNDPDWEFK